jgi:O-succinylbenzoate synthase
MKIEQIILREVPMKLVAPFETSMDRVESRRVLLVEANVDGVTGWGECVAGEDPYYSPETVETAWIALRDYLWPLMKEREFSSAAEVWSLLSRVRGHNMAKASLEAALWDAEAQQKNIPLWKLLGGTQQEISSGVSIGLKESLEVLVEATQKEIAAGYQRIKIKIKPGKDLELVRRLRQDFPRIKLMVDANSAYSMDDWPLLKQLEGFYLMMIEQPLGWDDLYAHIELQKRLDTPICLDECIHNEDQAQAAVSLGACKIINIKLGRVGGFTVAKRIHDICERAGVPVWCGGMLETGIGRAHNIALSTLPNFTLPGDVAASKRYWHEDIIDPEVTVSSRGTIAVPQGPGIGFTPRRGLIEKFATRTERLT